MSNVPVVLLFTGDKFFVVVTGLMSLNELTLSINRYLFAVTSKHKHKKYEDKKKNISLLHYCKSHHKF